MTPTELKDALQNFTGTENWHRFNALIPNVLLTDGAKYLADEAGAYWLMDMIGSHLPSVPEDEGFVVARYAGTPGYSGLFSLTDDLPARKTYAVQSIEYSDFPLKEIKLFAAREGVFWIILLPGEY